MSGVPLESVTAKRGTALARELALTTTGGAPANLTGATVRFRIWVEGAAADSFTSVLSILGVATLGIVSLAITAAQVTALPTGRLWYDVIIDGGDAVVEGRFYVEENRIR